MLFWLKGGVVETCFGQVRLAIISSWSIKLLIRISGGGFGIFPHTKMPFYLILKCLIVEWSDIHDGNSISSPISLILVDMTRRQRKLNRHVENRTIQNLYAFGTI